MIATMLNPDRAIAEHHGQRCAQRECPIVRGVVRAESVDAPVIDITALENVGALFTCARCHGLVAAAACATEQRLS